MVIQFRVDSSSASNAINQLISNLPNAVKIGRKRAAEDGINDAKRIVHIQTGALQRSIRILAETEDTTSYGSDLDYAYVEEFGDSRRPAHPYIMPRANALKEGIAAKYVNEEVRRIL